MKKSYFVKPMKGLKVPNPETKAFLPEEGELVSESSYWTRRIDSKEVEVLEEKTKQKAASKVEGEPNKDSQGGK